MIRDVVQREYHVRFAYCFPLLHFDRHVILSGILRRVKVEAPSY